MIQFIKNKIRQFHIVDLYFYKRKRAFWIQRGIHKKKSCHFVRYSNKREKQFLNLLKQIKISFVNKSRFQHWIDEDLYFINRKSIQDATSPCYRIILENSIDSLIKNQQKHRNQVKEINSTILRGIKKYIEKIVNKINDDSDDRLQSTKNYFKRMIDSKAESLEEALQRILFWSSLFWQSNHQLIGLGRLDVILEPYIGGLSDSEIINVLEDFIHELHRYYEFKSGSLMGDTGQIIILGGKTTDGKYFCNRLTYCFIQALKNTKLPDPKILLRVSKDMSQDLLELSIACNATGIGSPLLSNDDVVIPALEKFGYSHEDACNYITSACWEPFCYGNSLGKMNLAYINFVQILEKLYSQSGFENIPSFEELLDQYIEILKNEVNTILNRINKIQWEKDPLMTLFTDGCVQSGKDIADGGAIHNDYGILSVGLANTINSLCNIRNLIFEEKKYTLKELKDAAQSNYAENEDLRKVLFESAYFGKAIDSTLALINKITDTVEFICNGYSNRFGGKVKFGLSSPSYLDAGQNVGAVFDGRKAGEPLSVHISSKLGEPYTELIHFAGKLDYSGCKCNGNVVDFFVSPSFIQDNFEKFCSFIRSAIKVGFFQMQMNVVSSATLIAARKNPELYPNLIVRVWGFSAYFKDLPDQYKDLLIKRALESEMAA